MNRGRRKALRGIVRKLEQMEELQAEIRDLLEQVRGEETEALESMPESLQGSERGQQMQEYIDTMADVLDDLDLMAIDDLISALGEITG